MTADLVIQLSRDVLLTKVPGLTSNDLRCNVGATGSNTTTIDMKAGDAFTFSLDQAVYHQGPVSLFMSKAPGKAAEYDGGGNWFKIHDWLPTFGSGSASWPSMLIKIVIDCSCMY